MCFVDIDHFQVISSCSLLCRLDFTGGSIRSGEEPGPNNGHQLQCPEVDSGISRTIVGDHISVRYCYW